LCRSLEFSSKNLGFQTLLAQFQDMQLQQAQMLHNGMDLYGQILHLLEQQDMDLLVMEQLLVV